ncbi:MAG TPA: PhzF family phenazine biosynthesis protein [Ignavibacteria bacterium]|nr:PhzF family phenazine biosynthesis protein [Ignavibacteria bacterium]
MNKIFIVDAFTDKQFTGNPAAVCILEDKNSNSENTEWMQKLAAEMNLSETAFVKKLDGSNEFNLRWFTPEVEVELCGHATLAASHILWQTNILDENADAVFNTLYSGKLIATKKLNDITLDFPLIPVIDFETTTEIENALKVKLIYAGICGKSESNYIAELESEDVVRNFKPDFKLIAGLPKFGIIITSKSSNKDYDFVSRYFAPAKGIDEDPVTGSAHCSLAPYWSKKLNKTEMTAFQASKRGGKMKVRIADDRVLLTGKAVTVLKGELL